MATEKETTAPIPSVAPDGEQPSALARTNSITDIEEPHKRFGKIQAMTMPELMETRFRVRPVVIDGLLPAGTYLLAGAPKIGKSFLVLQMAYQVSMGEPFLGFPSRQGTVLYLALEDTCERLQKRLAQMTEQDSEHLILSVFSETLDEGLTERLSDFWSEHAETVVLLSHKKADSYIHIDVEFGEGEGKIPVDSIAKRAEAYKPKEKVTYKMIKEYIEAKYGFKVHTAYIAEVKRNLGLPMYDAPNAVEELKQPRKHPTPEKVEAIKDALRYFAVI